MKYRSVTFFIALHNSMTKLCREFFKYEDWLRKVMHIFQVHSNESACRNSGCLGLEQVSCIML